MSKVVAYCRVSTENQEQEGTSLDTQERACLAKALAAPGDEVVTLREVFSGLTLDRPELTRLRGWVRQGQVKAVVAYDPDRLARDGLYLLLLAEEIEKAGATLAFVTEVHENTPTGQLLTFVRGWASKLEALKIKERTTRGRKARGRAGKLVSYGNLYGYLYLKGKGESRGIRVPDSQTTPIVQDIFGWYAQEGLPMQGVQARLASQGTPSPTGRPRWGCSEIRAILRNEAYAGRTISRWEGGETMEIPGATPAIIKRTVWEAAQERLRFNKEIARRCLKRDYPLRGMVFCEVCGGRMKGQSRGARRYYRCQRHKPFVSIRAEGLESQVAAQVKHLLSNPALVKAQVARHRDTKGIEDLTTRLAGVDKRLVALGRGAESVARLVAQGLLDEKQAEAQLRESKRDREVLERERAALRGQLGAARLRDGHDIENLCAQVRESLDALRPGLDLMAQALGVRVTVSGGGGAVAQFNLPVEDGCLVDSLPRNFAAELAGAWG